MELKQRLEEIRNMDSIDDLEEQIALKDELAKQIQYLNDLEEDLLLQLEETKDFSAREDLNGRITGVRQDKDEKEMKLTDIEKMISETKEARNSEKQTAKNEFVSELQERQIKIKTQIDKKKNKIEEIEADRKQFLDTIEENKAVLSLKKPDSKVYQVASEENAKLIEEARKKNKRIKRLTREIGNLEKESEEIENVLQELEEMPKEIEGEPEEVSEDVRKEQEDLMWKEYRKEQEDKKTEEIDKAYTEKDEIERKEEEQVKAETEKEVAQYLEGENVKNLKQEPVEEVRGQAAEEKSQKVKQQTVKSKETKPEERAVNGSKNKITKVEFYISAGSVPSYRVTINNGKEDLTFEHGGYECVKMLSEKDIEELNKKHIYPEVARKYYDKGLADTLKDADRYYGTSGLEDYMSMIKDKELFKRYPDDLKVKDYLDVDYDFSELYEKPNDEQDKENLKQLKKLAKANARKGLASYEKAPNILQKIWKKFSQKLLPKAEERNTFESERREQLEHKNPTPELSGQDLEQSRDEATENEIKGAGNKYLAFKEGLKIKQKEAAAQREDEELIAEIRKTVEQAQADQRREALTGVVIDSDGHEIK